MADTGTDAVRWERRTAPELRALAAQDALVVLPVASMEQHGPHVPVWTDSMIGHACALRAAAEASDVPAIVLPPMWMGLSEHHLPFGGTITLDYATFHGVLRGVCRSIRADGFKRLLLVNSHGGNIDPLAVSARELCVEFDMPVVATTIFHVAGPKVGEILDTPARRPTRLRGRNQLLAAPRRRAGAAGGNHEHHLSRRRHGGRPVQPLLVLCRARPRHRRDRRPARRHGGKGRKAAGRGVLCPGGRHARQPAVARPRRRLGTRPCLGPARRADAFRAPPITSCAGEHARAGHLHIRNRL